FWHHMDPTHPQHDREVAKQFGSAILKVHRLMDEEVGRLLAAAGPDTLVALVSDHGGGPAPKEDFLKVWLGQRGWLKSKAAAKPNQTYATLMRRLRLTRENLTPRLDWPLAWWIRNRIPMRVQHALFPEETTTLANSVDWSRTRAYSFGNIGQI